MQKLDFVSIGDTVVDDFIRLKEAEVHCDINNDNCTISMRFGDKIPFESSTIVYGVGNSANAAVCAARLGLKTGMVTNIGKDLNGNKILENFANEGIDHTYIVQHEGAPTNYHYVLWYGDERTILVKHFEYPYHFPKEMPEPKTLYLSSIAQGTETYHDDIADYLMRYPNIYFCFQPGTFQMKMGAARLKSLYARANLFVVNKNEARRILGLPDSNEDVEAMAKKIQLEGSKTVIITDDRNGAYALNGTDYFHLPMYEDPNPPLQRTGAGDAFTSTVAAYMTMGETDLKKAMQHGLINAAYVVQDIGAQRGLQTKERLESLYSKAFDSNH